MSLIQVAQSTLSYQSIDNTPDLIHFCQLARSAGWFAIDSEFVRQRTYYAKLGLLQVHAQGKTAVIDPLAEIELTPLWEIVSDAEITTVLHAGGEDIELFYHQAGRQRPQSLFDTQIAAGLCGLGPSMGYAKLVEKLCGGVELDKSLSRTDWLKRPLSEQQLDYAAADASYLSAMYPYLLDLCQQREVQQLVEAESRLQVEKRTQQVADDLLYLFVGNAWQLNRQQLGVLRALASWRQNKAQQRDIPLGFIFKDGILLELARRQPVNEKQLLAVQDLSPLTRKYSGKEIIQVIAQAQQLSSDQLPQSLQRLDDMSDYKNAVKIIKAAVQRVAEELEVDTVLVASKKQINDFLNYHWQFTTQQQQRLALPDLSRGWRWQYLQAEVSSLI
ncbi:MAG: ribonuclease D [Pseudomonadota bacterium]